MQIKLLTLIAMLGFSLSAFSQKNKPAGEDADAPKKNAEISLKMGTNDTMYVATATLTDKVTHAPQNGIELIFYVQRTYGMMKVGDGTTNETGTTSVEFPLDTRPGDKSRQLQVIARLEDDKYVKGIVAKAIINSKRPFPADVPVPRALIGSRAPLWLILSFWGAVGTIYGIFFYVVILIYKIKKSSVRSLKLK